MKQTTIGKAKEIKGIGLHSGQEVKIKLAPALANTGITFYLHDKKNTITLSPTPNSVCATELATTLSLNNASLSTVEHLLAAINAMHIDNIQIHINGNSLNTEIPILDGSSQRFVEVFNEIGIKSLPQERTYARITKAFECVDNAKSIIARPYNGLFIDYTIEFDHHRIGKQRLALEITPESFKEIASARTFGFLKEVEYLHSKGLALGGSLANAIVLDEEDVINPQGLRYEDEFVRHKILDFIGDIAMLGLPLQGYFEVKCSGHKHNNLFLKELLKSHAFEIISNKETVEENAKYNQSHANILCSA